MQRKRAKRRVKQRSHKKTTRQETGEEETEEEQNAHRGNDSEEEDGHERAEKKEKNEEAPEGFVFQGLRVLGRGEDARDGKYGDCKEQVITQKPFRFSDYTGNMETGGERLGNVEYGKNESNNGKMEALESRQKFSSSTFRVCLETEEGKQEGPA